MASQQMSASIGDSWTSGEKAQIPQNAAYPIADGTSIPGVSSFGTLAAMPAYQDFVPSIRFRDLLALSPNGNNLAYVDDAQGQFNVSVQPVADGSARHLTSFTKHSVRRADWHPDARSLLVLADLTGNENHQLYTVDVESSSVTPLTDVPDARFLPALGDPFSHDGAYLAYAGNDRSPGDQDVLIRNLHTGEVKRVYTGGGRVVPGHWSPDGTRLTIIDWRGATTDQVIHVLSLDDGEINRISPAQPGTYYPGPWLPDGSGVLVMSDFERDHTGLGIIELASGNLSWLDTPEWDVEEVALSRDGNILAWLVNVNGASQLRARALSTGTDLAWPDLPTGAACSLRLTNNGRHAVMLMSTPTKPWNVLTVDLQTGCHRWLTTSRPSVPSTTLVDASPVHYPARNGRQVPAYLYLPQAVDKRLPVVLAIHGGPPSQERPTYSNDGLFQYLASQGVAVFAPNVRGSAGYGLAYQQAVHRDWGGVDLEDLDDAARYLKEQPWVDSERIGLIGRSYGGFNVLSCVSRLPEHNWAAAVSWCGPSNLITFSRAQPPTWRAQVALMIGDPDTDAEFLASRSPITYADDIRAPLFVIQGANDARVSKHESDQIVARLRARGIEVRYDVYADEGHSFGNRHNQMKARSDAADFLLAHLLRHERQDDPTER